MLSQMIILKEEHVLNMHYFFCLVTSTGTNKL